VTAFAFGNADDEALAVDVPGPDAEGLAQTEPALVDEGEVGAVATVAEGAQEQGDVVAGEDVGQWFVALDGDAAPDVPGKAEVVAVEGAQGADGLVEGGGAEVAVVLEVDEEVENGGGGQIGQRRVRGSGEVGGELPDPPEVGLPGARPQSLELDEALEVRIPRLGGEEIACGGGGCGGRIGQFF
jgi:hypothetical protein